MQRKAKPKKETSKRSSLDMKAALTQLDERMRGFERSPLTWLLLVAGIALIAYSAWQVSKSFGADEVEARALVQGRQAAEQVQRGVHAFSRLLVDEEVQSLARLAFDGDEFMEGLRRYVESRPQQVTQIRLLPSDPASVPLSELGNAPYALLDAMLQAERNETAPLQVLPGSTGDSALVGVARVSDDDRTLGYLMIEASTEPVLERFKVPNPAGGFVALEQDNGRAGTTRLKTIGVDPGAAGYERIPVPGSMMQVVVPARIVDPAARQRAWLLMALGVLLLLLGLRFKVWPMFRRDAAPAAAPAERLEPDPEPVRARALKAPAPDRSRDEPSASKANEAATTEIADSERDEVADAPAPAPVTGEDAGRLSFRAREGAPQSPLDWQVEDDDSPAIGADVPDDDFIVPPTPPSDDPGPDAGPDAASEAHDAEEAGEAEAETAPQDRPPVAAVPDAPPSEGGAEEREGGDLSDVDFGELVEQTRGKRSLDPEANLPRKRPDLKPVAAPVELLPEIFRAYDVRGVVGKTLDAGVAHQLGQAIGSLAIESDATPVVVGRDGRHSGPELVDGLVAGMNAAGCDVIDVGPVPTGALYFAAHHFGSGSGVMVTGSHNPPDYNGFKTMIGGETLFGDQIHGLYERIQHGNLRVGRGQVETRAVLDDYRQRIADDVTLARPLKVVVDCGNGIGGAIGPQVLEAIGADVVPLYAEVDGDFPNHHPDPSEPENLEDLIAAVSREGADLGMAFDGDADRLGVVTPDGEIIYADRVMMLLAGDVLSRNPGATIIYDVKCTGHLDQAIRDAGGEPLMWKTGHSLIKAKMKAVDAPFAGEMSGHFFFKERWFGVDDGIYAAARLLEILAADERAPGEVLSALPSSVSTPELKVDLKEEGRNHEFIEAFRSKAEFEDARLSTIDGLRADWVDGWGLVRASNTTPVLVLRFDADTASALRRIQADFAAQMLKVNPDLELPF